jgi:photosystem II stability/assembly factor-like uncharacterized protein
MKHRLSCLLILSVPTLMCALSASAADSAAGSPARPAAATPAHRMYASASMTKAQVNSPTPADFGLFYRAENGSWKPFGPRVGSSGLTVAPGDPSVMFLPGADGVMRSRDGGKTWRQVTGWDVADVRCIVFDPANPSLVYAATQWGPIRSTDGGESWQPAQQGLAKPYCQTLVADPRHSGRVLLGTEDGIYVSTDAAQSWTRVDSPATTILRIVRSAADAQLLLAGTLGRGAWLSRDNGATWTAVDPGSAKANLYAAALSLNDAATMAVGGWGVGVRVSTDGGATWTDRSAGLPVKNVLVLAFDPDTKGRLWASTFEEGSFYSDDLGRTWKNGGLYGANGTDYIFVPASRR